MAVTAEQVTDAITYHGEGPCWWPGWGGLRWVDMLAGDLLTLRADGGVDRLHVGDVAAFVRPRLSGGTLSQELERANVPPQGAVPLAAGDTGAPTGSRTQKSEPSPGSLATPISPPIAVTSRRAMASPSPVPSACRL